MTSDLKLVGQTHTLAGGRSGVTQDMALCRDDLGLFAVADGEGEPPGGELVAQQALGALCKSIGDSAAEIYTRPDVDVLGVLEQAKRLSLAVHQAHREVRATLEARPDLEGASCSVVSLLEAKRTGHVHVAHVGNCRCYRLRHGRLELLTEDHTLGRDLLETQPDARESVLLNLPAHSVVRALGVGQALRVTLRTTLPLPGDRYFLCTDGLHRAVPFDELWRVARTTSDPGEVASALLEEARKSEHRDDVALVVVDVREQGTQEEHITRPYNDPPEPPDRPPGTE